MTDIRHVDVIALNFKRRLSGVTSTVIQLVPFQARLGVRIAVLGPGLPDDAGLPKIGFRSLLGLWRAPDGRGHRIWHARRNNEMGFGLFLRSVLRMPLKLVFTSAAQRRHSAYTRFLIRQMDRVIATSDRSASFLEVPFRVIRHGVDLDAFYPPQTAEDGIAATGLPGQHLIGCFGRIRHQKGTDLFVRAMIELLPHHPDWTAVICGRATASHTAFADGLKAEIAAAGLSDRIVFMGEVPDVKVWYRRLTLYVAPSRNEGFGLTPLEAMASQTAVVASDAGAYAEMIVPGKTGAVTPAGDFEALREAIRPYLADPDMALRHAAQGLAEVRENFALEKEAKAVNAVYADLA